MTESARQVTPAIRIITTDKEWIVQTRSSKRSREGAKSLGDWTSRAYITSKGMLYRELSRLIGNGAVERGLRGYTGEDVIQWLGILPRQHPIRETA